jgi:hypothetical protein
MSVLWTGIGIRETEGSGSTSCSYPEAPKTRREPVSESSKMIQAMAKSAAHAIGSQVGRQIIRGVLGSIFGKGRR